MSGPEKHSRRDFLQGRAAVRAAAAQAQSVVEAASELLSGGIEETPVAHIHASRRAMACEFSVQYHEADQALTEGAIDEDMLAALDLIEGVEDQLTIYREQSDVIEINQQAAEQPVEVDDELLELLQLCQQLYRDTKGAFDITSGPLSRAWGFLQREGQLPEEAAFTEALEQVRGDRVVLDAKAKTVSFTQPSVEINFNAIGKGYALDKVAAFLQAAGRDDYLWQGGGSSVLARGANRASRKHCWTLGLRHPLNPQQRLAEFHLRNRALATAGGATQFFEHEGQRFSHILDPRTGWPAKGVFTSTVLAPTAALADGLATAFFVMGTEAVEEYCSRHSEVGVVLVCPTEDAIGFRVDTFGIKKEEWTLLT